MPILKENHAVGYEKVFYFAKTSRKLDGVSEIAMLRRIIKLYQRSSGRSLVQLLTFIKQANLRIRAFVY